MARTLVAICVLSLLCAPAALAVNATDFIFQLDGQTLPHIKSCEQIGSQTQVIEVLQGNVVTHVPGRTTFLNINCSEIVTQDTTLYDWRHTVEIGNVQRKSGQIILTDSQFNPITTINFGQSWPSSLFVDKLDAASNAAITQTISIVVDQMSRQ